MAEIVVTNVVVSRPPNGNRQPAAAPTAYAKIIFMGFDTIYINLVRSVKTLKY